MVLFLIFIPKLVIVKGRTSEFDTGIQIYLTKDILGLASHSLLYEYL